MEPSVSVNSFLCLLYIIPIPLHYKVTSKTQFSGGVNWNDVILIINNLCLKDNK